MGAQLTTEAGENRKMKLENKIPSDAMMKWKVHRCTLTAVANGKLVVTNSDEAQ